MVSGHVKTQLIAHDKEVMLLNEMFIAIIVTTSNILMYGFQGL